MQNYQKLPKQPHFSSDNFLSAHFSLRRGESETAIPSLIDGETPARCHSPCSGAEKWMPNGGGKSPKENPSRRMAAAVLANGKSAAEWRLPRCRTESLLPSRRCRSDSRIAAAEWRFGNVSPQTLVRNPVSSSASALLSFRPKKRKSLPIAMLNTLFARRSATRGRRSLPPFTLIPSSSMAPFFGRVKKNTYLCLLK